MGCGVYTSWRPVHLTKVDISTTRPKRRLDGPALSGYLLYSFANPAYANSYHHHLVRVLVCNILIKRYDVHITFNKYSIKRCIKYV